MNEHWIYLASDVVVPLVGVGALGVSLLFAWLAPWSRRRA